MCCGGECMKGERKGGEGERVGREREGGRERG